MTRELCIYVYKTTAYLLIKALCSLLWGQVFNVTSIEVTEWSTLWYITLFSFFQKFTVDYSQIMLCWVSFSILSAQCPTVCEKVYIYCKSNEQLSQGAMYP